MLKISMVKSTLLVAFAVFSLGLSASAQAGRPSGEESTRPHPLSGTGGGASADAESAGVSISGDDSVAIKEFIAADYRQRCAQEADRNKNKCPVRGEESRYKIGTALSNDAGGTNIPDKLRTQLKPESGHQYILVNGDVVLANSASKIVVDAVTLSSALGE